MIQIAYKMKMYREILDNILKPNDTVCELGCHVGKSSQFILERISNGELIALDNSPEADNKMNILKKDYLYYILIRITLFLLMLVFFITFLVQSIII